MFADSRRQIRKGLISKWWLKPNTETRFLASGIAHTGVLWITATWSSHRGTRSIVQSAKAWDTNKLGALSQAPTGRKCIVNHTSGANPCRRGQSVRCIPHCFSRPHRERVTQWGVGFFSQRLLWTGLYSALEGCTWPPSRHPCALTLSPRSIFSSRLMDLVPPDQAWVICFPPRARGEKFNTSSQKVVKQF